MSWFLNMDTIQKCVFLRKRFMQSTVMIDNQLSGAGLLNSD